MLLVLLALASCGGQEARPFAEATVTPPTIAPPSSVATFTPLASANTIAESPRPGPAPAPTETPSAQAVVPAPTAATPTDSADPMSTPRPDPSTPFPPPNDTTVRLAREQDGWRLEPAAGRFSTVQWSEDRPARLEAQWVPAQSAQQSFFSYLVDPEPGAVRLADGGFLVAASENISQPLSVRLFDVRTGKHRSLGSDHAMGYTNQADIRTYAAHKYYQHARVCSQ